MSYVVAVRFNSTKSEVELAHLLQQVFDKNGVNGTFMFGPKQVALVEVMFQRDEEEDATEVAAHMPALEGCFVNEAVCDLLLDELTVYDPPEELQGILTALEGRDVEVYGTNRLRDALTSLTDALDLAA